MTDKILLIQGHPDTQQSHYCHALGKAYGEGARQAGHEMREVLIAQLDFPLLRNEQEFYGSLPPSLHESRDALQWANHIVLIYPLWHGTMPAMVKGWVEQLFRPGIALSGGENQNWPKALLKNKSCRIIITMGMPAMAYRWFFRAHSLKSLERNVLKMSGIGPIRESLIGMVASDNPGHREKWLKKVQSLGRHAR